LKAPRRDIKRIIGFFCTGGLLAVGLHLLIGFGLKRVNASDAGAFNRAMSGRVNAQVIVCGSSRAYRHYDPRIIHAVTGKTAFNLARNGSHTDVQMAVLQAYLRHNAKPELVVENLDMHSFTLTPQDEIYAPVQYVPYLNEPQLFQALLQINPRVWKWKYIPLYGYVVEDVNLGWMYGLAALAGVHPREDHFDGFCPMDKTWNGDFDRFKAMHPDGVGFGVPSNGVRVLEELIQTCQSNQIPILLVYSPQYCEMLDLVTNRAVVFAKFRDIADHYGVPFWDYSQSQYCSNRDLFYNSQHLNARGAEAFSRDLANRLLSLPQAPASRQARLALTQTR
jgi:hypothetical protein